MARVIDATIRLRDMFSPILRQVDNAIQEHERATSAMRQSTAAMSVSLSAASRAAQDHSKEIIRMGKSISSAGDSITSMSNKAAMLAAPLMAAAAAGLKMNSDLTNGMAKVSTLVDTTVVDMAALRRGIIGVSNDTGAALNELTEAQYQAISANVDSAKSVEFVRQAVISSKAGFTDTTTAVDGLTTVLNAYGLSAESAGKISDQMLMTQNLGKTTFGEMAAVIGQVASSASLAKVGTDELFTSIAVLTKNGIKTPEAITEINGIMTAIAKQSKQSTQMAKSMGIDFSEAHMKAVGMGQFLAEIKNKVGDDGNAIIKLFGRVEAANGFKVLTKDMADYQSILDRVTNSVGATQQAYEKTKTPAEQAAIAMQQLRIAGMELSQGLAPLLKSSTILMKQLAAWLNSLTDAQRDMLSYTARNIVIFVVLTGVIGRVIHSVGKVTETFGKMAASAKTNGGWIAALSKKFPMITSAAGKMSSVVQLAMSGTKKALTSMGQPLAMFNLGVVKAFFHPIESIRKFKTSVGNMASSVLKSFGNIPTKLQAFGGSIGNALSGAISQAGKIAAVIASAVRSPMAMAQKTMGMFKNGIMLVAGALKGGLAGALRTVSIALRGLFLNPIGIAIMVIIALAVVIYTHWGAIKTFLTAAFSAIGDRVKQMVAIFSERFGAIWGKAQNVFGRLVALVSTVWGRIENLFSDGGGTIGQTINLIGSILAAGLGVSLNIALTVIETFIGTACVLINGILDVFNGVITFLTGVFSGNWSLAWEGIVQIFSGVFGTIAGICETILGSVKSTINAVVGGINSISVDVPDWVPGVGGQHYQPSIPMLATGTENWTGGLAMIHDAGAEIVDLPQGARVYPHDKSIAMAFNAGREHQAIKREPKLAPVVETGGNRTQNNNQKTEKIINVTIPKFAEQIIIRETADAHEVMKYFASEIDKMAGNMA